MTEDLKLPEVPKPAPAPAARRKGVGRIWPYMLFGAGVSIALVGGLGGWAASTEIAGAIVAGGTVVVESNVKKVQHQSGGVVGEIHVKNGDAVKAGDLLMRLDQTITRANLQVVLKQLDQLDAREARLKAERDGIEEIAIPQGLTERESDPAVKEIIVGEQSLFASRRKSRDGQKSQLRERIAQLNEEVAGITSQIKAKGREIELIGKELTGIETLEAKQLVTTNRINNMRREAARIEGERAQLQASVAQARGKTSEIELQILQIDQDFRTELVKELREVQSKQAEFAERKVAAEDQLKRVDIRAPQDGVVHQLNVHTVGGVVNQAEPIMLIVPADDKLLIEAKIAPQDIDQVRAGHKAFVRFSAFNSRTTPEVEGEVKSVSADLTHDPQQPQIAYYTARVTIPDEQMKKLEGSRLVPGMPAEVHVKTSDRTALSYLMKPITDQFARAFRER